MSDSGPVARSLEQSRTHKRLRGRLTPRTRSVIAAALLALVVLVEYRLSTLPMATELTGTLHVPAGTDLTLAGLRSDGPLIEYSGALGEAADIRFDRARLSAETLGLLRAVGLNLSEAEGPISWITRSQRGSRTVLEVSFHEPDAGFGELRFRALPAIGLDEPQLEIEPRLAALRVLIGTPFTPEKDAAQSEKTLIVGGRKVALSGAVPIHVVVSDGASFRARFSHAAGARDARFILGRISVDALEQPGLAAYAVGMQESGASDVYTYFACAASIGAIAWSGGGGLEHGRCNARDRFFRTSALRVTGQALELDVSGAGWAQRNGESIGVDLLSRVAQNPVIAGILLTANVALLAWFLFELFGHKLGRARANWTGGVFISYRRADSAAQAGRLFDHLVAHFGADRVFMDVDTIQLGADFARKIRESLDVTDALLAVIGRQWLDAKDDAGRRRLDNPDDFVRTEIATALERGTWVIPVLVGGATMPREDELPPSLTALAYRNAIDLSDARFTSDMKALIEALERGREHGDVEHASVRGEAARLSRG